MRIGITYLSVSPTVDRESAREKYREFLRQVEWAGGHDFAGIWITEHHFSGYSLSASPLLLLTRAAAAASTLRIGTGILVLPLWDPVRLAADLGTLDTLSDGRLDIGIGRGYQPHEFQGFGRALDTSRERFEEAADLLVRLLEGPVDSYAGAYHCVDAPVTVLPRPVQTPRPPVWLAAVSHESTRFAVRRGFHLLGLALATPAELAQQWRTAQDLAAAENTGTEGLEYGVNRFVYCGTDPDARRAAAREVARQIQTSRALAQGAVPDGGLPPLPTRVDPADEALAAERLLAGSPDEIRKQLAELADVGVTQVNAAFEYGALPAETAHASLRLFAKEVLPL
ncbi:MULTISPECIES: LLM class flavin-dependent oxidoreductase [unclassified Streptomyces]|uniref:LLM class flavin-dependent oxidoreductase n=1 Tax=unclassified Streptomyces TaxID=2593676 RepID=UPI00030C3B96|nr:LLM class flavin-dependent oxidoreductase [Streptomyces sp. e14]